MPENNENYKENISRFIDEYVQHKLDHPELTETESTLIANFKELISNLYEIGISAQDILFSFKGKFNALNDALEKKLKENKKLILDKNEKTFTKMFFSNQESEKRLVGILEETLKEPLDQHRNDSRRKENLTNELNQSIKNHFTTCIKVYIEVKTNPPNDTDYTDYTETLNSLLSEFDERYIKLAHDNISIDQVISALNTFEDTYLDIIQGFFIPRLLKLLEIKEDYLAPCITDYYKATHTEPTNTHKILNRFDNICTPLAAESIPVEQIISALNMFDREYLPIIQKVFIPRVESLFEEIPPPLIDINEEEESKFLPEKPFALPPKERKLSYLMGELFTSQSGAKILDVDDAMPYKFRHN